MSKTTYAKCKQCETGSMVRKKKYVLGAGGAILRFFLMVPGVIMLVTGIAGFGGSAKVASESDPETMLTNWRQEAQQKGLTAEMIADIEEDGELSNRFPLDENSRMVVDLIETDYVMVKSGVSSGVAGGVAAVGGGLSFILILFALGMMAFGFLIGIRKWKLVCDNCGFAMNAA